MKIVSRTRGFLMILATMLAFSACAGGDASIHLTWTIGGSTANSDECLAVNAAWVRIVEDENDDGSVDRYYRQMACSEGSGETARYFESDKTTHVAFELGQLGGDVLVRVPATGFTAFTPDAGSNNMQVDFVAP
jgi:hypothetical protein